MNPIILGIDPGTTVGLAILSIDGTPTLLHSEKELSIERIIPIIIAHGRPILVSCDKQQPPHFVKKIASRLGAKIFSPKKDLLVVQKQQLTKGYYTRTEHQRDALASALFAHKRIKHILKKSAGE